MSYLITITRQALDRAFEFKVAHHEVNSFWFEQYQDVVSRKRGLEVELFMPSQTMTSEGILEEMKTQGLRPATFRELLAFGIKHPEVVIRFDSIMGLGSTMKCKYRGTEYVPKLREYAYTWEFPQKRISYILMDKTWWTNKYPVIDGKCRYRFLAVRQQTD